MFAYFVLSLLSSACLKQLVSADYLLEGLYDLGLRGLAVLTTAIGKPVIL